MNTLWLGRQVNTIWLGFPYAGESSPGVGAFEETVRFILYIMQSKGFDLER